MTKSAYQAFEAELRDARQNLERRLAAIRDDRRRESAPLERDLEDQAIQRENDAALDALDDQGRRELDAIDAALARIASGSYGQCTDCAGAIETDRLKAHPVAARCVTCAGRESAVHPGS